MRNTRLYQGFVTLLAGLFILLQASAIAHAAQYGEAAHEHDGKVCVLDAVTEDTEVIVPAVTFKAGVYDFHASDFETVFISLSYQTPQGRAPPPRSPPLSSL